MDDQVLLRESLARLLAEAGMRVVASEGDIDGFLGAVDTSHPDVAIIDIRLPPTFTDDGLRAADLQLSHRPAALPQREDLEGYVRRIFDKLGLTDTPDDNRRVLPASGSPDRFLELHLEGCGRGLRSRVCLARPQPCLPT